MRRVDWADLDMFAAVVRHGNFKRAALELGISATTLSRTVSSLESRLRVRLLDRTAHGIAPTGVAEKILCRLVPALSEITRAVDHVSASRGAASGLVRLNAPTPIVEFVLAPLIKPFLESYPQIKLEIIADDSLADIVKHGFDAGVRYGKDAVPADMIAIPIACHVPRFVLVASPECLNKYGHLRDPHELRGCPHIAHRFPNGNIFPWQFEKDGQRIEVKPSGSVVLNDPRVEMRAAVDGLGFLFTLDQFADDAVAAGHVVCILEEWCPVMKQPHLYYPRCGNQPAAFRAFIGFMRDRVVLRVIPPPP